MKNLLMIFTMLVLLFSCEPVFAQTGSLTQGDSIIVVDPGYNRIVEIVLVDSASTADTCVVEMLNPINNTWITIRVIDQLTGNGVTVLVPGVSATGKLYEVPLSYPAVLRLRKTDVAQLTESIYYNIRIK